MTFLRIYFAFAAGYLLSYLFRTVNAVISPELSRDLSLDPSSLGLLTSAYFLAFGAAQLPVGMLLDRYGRFTVLNEGFGRELAGRTNTTLNLAMFTGSFLAQWGIGATAEASRVQLGYSQADGLRVAFGVALALNVLTFAWFARGWRRHAPHTAAPRGS